MKALLMSLGLAALLAPAAYAEEVQVKGRRDAVQLKSENFSLHKDFDDSRLIKEIHYDEANQYLVYRLKNVYYQRCGVPKKTVDNWIEAESVNNHYKTYITNYYSCCDENMPDCEYK